MIKITFRVIYESGVCGSVTVIAVPASAFQVLFRGFKYDYIREGRCESNGFLAIYLRVTYIKMGRAKLTKPNFQVHSHSHSQLSWTTKT
jgi:hypothetical protein